MAAPRFARADLEAGAKRYLAAIVSGKPADANLSARFRATENAAPVAPGEGLWQMAQAFPGFPSFLSDALSGNVVVVGAVQTKDGLRPIMLRLRFEGDAVLESELIMASPAAGFFSDPGRLLYGDIIYEGQVPSERRSDRDGLQAVAQSYWTALGESDGSLAKVHYRADRYANGKKITNNLELLLSPDKAVHSINSLITATRSARPVVREPRFAVLDPERGVAVSIAMLDFADDPGNPRPDTGTFYTANTMKVADGQIRILDAIHTILPRGICSSWA